MGSHLCGTKACVKCMQIKRQQDELNEANAELQKIIDDLLNQLKRAELLRLRGGNPAAEKPKAKEHKLSCCVSPEFAVKMVIQYRKELREGVADKPTVKAGCEKILRKYKKCDTHKRIRRVISYLELLI